MSYESDIAPAPSQETVNWILHEIRRLASPNSLKGMSRFGIKASRAFGVSIPELRGLAKKTGTSHGIALKLWESGIHEARILASMIDDQIAWRFGSTY